MERRGNALVFVVSAPSGTGKTTLLKRMMEEIPGLKFSVSHTTRPPRAGEKDGRDYHFVSPEAFQGMVERGEFVEWAEVLRNRYGTTWSELDSGGKDVILDIDTQGAGRVRERIEGPVLIFLLPPSFQALRERLTNRRLDPAEVVEYRLAKAVREIEEARWYDYVVVNDRVEEALGKLKAIVQAERCRRAKASILEKIEKEWDKDHGENYR